MRARRLLIAILAASLAGGAPAQARQYAVDPALAAASEADRDALARIEARILEDYEAGRFAEAEAGLVRILPIEIRVYGETHPVVAATHGSRGAVAEAMGDYGAAEAHRRREVALRERLGDEEALAESRRALGANLVAQQNHADALPVLIQAHDGLTRFAPPSDERAVSAAYNLARALYVSGDTERALAVLIPSARALDDPGQDGSAWAALVAFDHGFLLNELGRDAEAEPAYGRACGLWRAHGGVNAAPGEACLSQGEILKDLGRDAEAEPLLAFALDAPDLSAARRSHAAEHLITVRTRLLGAQAADEALLRRALALSTEAWGEDHTATAFAANRLGLMLRDRVQRNEDALPLFIQAHETYAAAQGPVSRDAMVTAANAMFTLNSLQRPGEALESFAGLFAAAEATVFADDDERAAWRLLNIARSEALKDTGELDQARAILEARLTEQHAEGAGPAELYDTHTRIAQVAAHQLDWPAMEEHRRQALNHQRQVGDPLALARATMRYGHVLGQMSDAQAAYDLLTDAVRRLDGLQAASADERLFARMNLGHAAMQLGRLDEADRLLEGAVREYRTLDPAHGTLRMALGYLATLRLAQDRLPAAEALHLEALGLARAANDEQDEVYVLGSLGELWRYMGRSDEAESALRTVLDYTTRTHGPNHVLNAIPLKNLAIHLDGTGRKERALDLLMQALALEESALGAGSPQVLRTRVQLGRVMSDLGRHQEAEVVFEETARRALETLGETNAATQEATTQLGYVISLQGRYAEATGILRSAAGMVERSFGADSRQMINVLQILSLALYMDGQFDETIVTLSRAAELADAHGARWPATLVDVRSNLGRTYIEAGRPAEALPPLREAAAMAARISRERASAITSQAEISRAPFRALVEAAWRVSGGPAA